MPIEKVAVVHKFGIISHSQRLELQDRLLKQSYLQAYGGTRRPEVSGRNPLEVTEEFVQQFNAAESLDEQEKHESLAGKMLERIKRRAGLKGGGVGEHVDLPVAWTELSQLAQCKGRVQEECLDVLITSLDQAPLGGAHIPALFFLAETTLYWLRTDAINQPYLRTGEIKLLRMGQLVFARLFYHHMAGQLQGHEDFKNRLFTYLEGFGECQEAYNPYPNALLAIRYINEVGKMIVGDSNMESGEVKEGDNMVAIVTPRDVVSGAATPIPPAQHQASESDPLFREVSASFGGRESCQSGAISSSVHDLSPTLWHALDVWRCVNQLGGGLADALCSLAHCGMGLGAENWVDGLCALQILADAARANLGVLRVAQNLARGIAPRPRTSPPQHNTGPDSKSHGPRASASTSKVTSKGSLSDIYEGSEKEVPAKTTKGPLPHTCQQTHHRQQKTATERSLKTNVQESTTHSKTLGTETVPDTGRQAVVGSQPDHSGRASQASSVPTYTNALPEDTVGLQGWHWEVAITYAEIMADICLHGATSSIQKLALVGTNKDISELHKVTTLAAGPMKSAGLLDLLYFRAAKEEHDGSSNDWSWRVRYSAIQGLVKICRCSAGDQSKEGMRTVAWNALLTVHSIERDTRVLEAFKVGQVDASIETVLSQAMTVPVGSLGAKVAGGLSILYLPALPPPVQATPAKPKPIVKPVKQDRTTVINKPARTSLRDELMLATALYEPPVDFNARTSFDLKRIVEDQWRKHLQQQLDDEGDERQKDLVEKQKEVEDKQLKIKESHRAKLKIGGQRQ